MTEKSLLLINLTLQNDLTEVINIYSKQANTIDVYSSKYWLPTVKRKGVETIYPYEYRGSLKNILNAKLILFSFLTARYNKIAVNLDKRENIKYVFFTLLFLKGGAKELYISREIIKITPMVWLKSSVVFINWFSGMIIELIGSVVLLLYLILRNKIDKCLL